MAEDAEILERARAAYAEHRWADARKAFVAAREQTVLEADDMAALGEAAWWQGDVDECLTAFEEAYRLYLHGAEPAPRSAAKLGMEIALFWFLRGEDAIGSGWISRAQRLLEAEGECVEQGYLMSLGIGEAIAGEDFLAAIDLAGRVVELARHYQDETLAALALVGEGIATIKQGDVMKGMGILDEAMLPVVAGEVEAAYAGNIYCQLMQVCHELADVRRAQQWTDATTRWCEGFESAVMFVGICRVHRAELLQEQGEWERAEEEARLVCDELDTMNLPAVAEGSYQLGEVLRLRGDLDEAEQAYGRAHQLGRDPQPGLALLRLSEGKVDAAATAIAGALRVTTDPLARARLCFAQVQIAIHVDDLNTARVASEELTDAADRYGSSGLLAAAPHASGAVALAEGQLADALAQLQEACRRWRELAVPYWLAQSQVLLAQALWALGNDESAARELDAATDRFEALGALLDAQHAADLRSSPELPGGLTRREVEVLRLVAAGMTNKEVAERLFLSEKTVARHLHNIYTKLGVSSRTAAAAYAFQHGLAAPTGDE